VFCLVKVVVRGRNNYWRFTVHSWALEVREILEYELGEPVEVSVEEGNNEDPEILVNGVPVCLGVPGEEGYLIEIVKKAVLRLRDTAPGTS